MQNWLTALLNDWPKWFRSGANKITWGRMPCLILVLCFVFVLGRQHHGWFWAGALALVIGMALDKLDGWWANHMDPEPTIEGQFLDPLIDKLFIWPIWLAIVLVQYQQLSAAWLLGSLLLLCLDIRSAKRHFENYVRDSMGGVLNREHGAVWQGKLKFFLQNVIMCVHVSSLCPKLPELRPEETMPNWHQVSWFFREAGDYLSGITLWILLAAICLASWSLIERALRTKEEKKEEKK